MKSQKLSIFSLSYTVNLNMSIYGDHETTHYNPCNAQIVRFGSSENIIPEIVNRYNITSIHYHDEV